MRKEQEIRSLWQQTFHDDERFVELLFTHLYRDENAIGFEQNGRWISALQMLPYRMKWGNLLLDVAYISGAATLPEYRNQGWMSRLLSRAFDEMHARRIPLSVLIPAEPWLYDYYAARGYSPVFFREEIRYNSAHRFLAKDFYRVEPSQDELFAFFETQMLRRPICIQHSRADFEVVCGDVALEGGAILSLADEAGQLSAVAFTLCRGDEVLVKELLATTNDAEAAMLHEVQTQFPEIPICHYRPTTGEGEAVCIGMMRIVDAEAVLSVMAANNPSLNLKMRVTDSLLSHNTGDYCLSHGVCTREAVNIPDYQVDIDGLAHLLFKGNPAPYMSLMLD